MLDVAPRAFHFFNLIFNCGMRMLNFKLTQNLLVLLSVQ
jgi:hypothetical protein